MSRLTDLIQATKAKDPALGAELEREFKALSSRRSFGLNFERHRPEAVELPQRPVRKGDKVRLLQPRGSTDRGDQRLWRVARIEKADGNRLAHLRLLADDEEAASSPVEDLVVVAEFRDPIYPGLVSTGKVERGGDKPFHTVVCGENFHVLRALTYTHKGKVDAIYIDPPYNTRDKDWKYNNNYVESDDLYRHSKWLAFMERRLLVARELLKPEESVLIVTIDEKEYLRLGLLLEQVFPEATIQMVTTCIKPSGSQRTAEFSRVEEYLFFVMLGSARPVASTTDMLRDGTQEQTVATVTWQGLRRRGSTDWRRSHRPNGFYPILVSTSDGTVVGVGEPLPLEVDRATFKPPSGSFAVWPLDPNLEEGRWQIAPTRLREQLAEGTAALRSADPATGSGSVIYLKGGDLRLVREGHYSVDGRESDGRVRVLPREGATRRAKTMWVMESHDASAHGTALLSRFLPGRQFPFPKSLYAVEDALRFFIRDKPNAVVLDFFAGSGTTAQAVMRLNRQHGGERQCIAVTNNEVSAAEDAELSEQGFRRGDPEWEKNGICDFITKPRVEAAISGRTSLGGPVEGDYRFTDSFPMSEGFEANAEFFTLTYESPVGVGHNRSFERIASLLWLRAGARGGRVDQVPSAGWAVVDAYGVLFDLDLAKPFCDTLAEVGAGMAFVVTDDDRRFQAVVRRLPDGVEPVRLYESYLSNFRFVSGE